MLEKAFEWIKEHGKANLHEINGSMYSDQPLYRQDKYIPMAAAIEMSTLSSLVEYIKSNVDTMAEKMIVHVVSPVEVRFFSQLNEKREREELVRVRAKLPTFEFNTFIEHEKFTIGVQSKFVDDPETDKALIMKFSGTVENGTVASYGDDGVTQKATVKTGISSKDDALVPNPVKLKPFRTFTEVEQPASEFIFRMKQGKYEGIECAIFEADGGAWVREAMKNIHRHLEFELVGITGISIIS